jgi:hypothetical protein
VESTSFKLLKHIDIETAMPYSAHQPTDASKNPPKLIYAAQNSDENAKKQAMAK